MNTALKNKKFITTEFEICPMSGQITSGSKITSDYQIVPDHQSVRLGPVNMKVLVVLLQHSGQVVSREQLFDDVWPNQVVSDDTLTRCISDLRSQLKRLSKNGTIKYIETVPKRGYRWLFDVSIKQDSQKTIVKMQTSTQTKDDSCQSPAPFSHPTGAVSQQPVESNLKSLALLTASGIVIFGLLSYLLLWSVNYFNDSDVVKVALLPIRIDLAQKLEGSIGDVAVNGRQNIKSSNQSLTDLARRFEDSLKQQILATDSIRFLSSKTIEARPQNLYPYLSREFSARWVIETRVRSINKEIQVVVNIVDARTAIVSDSISVEIKGNQRDIENFIDSLLLLLVER